MRLAKVAAAAAGCYWPLRPTPPRERSNKKRSAKMKSKPNGMPIVAEMMLIDAGKCVRTCGFVTQFSFYAWQCC